MSVNEKVAALVQAVPDNEPGPNVLLMGMPGAGKTYSITSLLDAGLEVFVIFTEQGRESLLESVIDNKRDRSKLHWASVAPGAPGFGAMKTIARDINRKEQKELQSAKGVHEKHYQQMITLIGLCENFIDQNGESFGDATTWSNKRALVIDGLSGINVMAMDLVVGAKPVKTIADWGIAMDAEMRYVLQCANSLMCTFVMLAHLELNKDEVEGKIYRYPKLLGNKNTYDFGKHFSDVIVAEDAGNSYTWSTMAKNMQLKARNLPKKSGMKPDFVPLIETWSSRYVEE